jgi:hypothetical protein
MQVVPLEMYNELLARFNEFETNTAKRLDKIEGVQPDYMTTKQTLDYLEISRSAFEVYKSNSILRCHSKGEKCAVKVLRKDVLEVRKVLMTTKSYRLPQGFYADVGIKVGNSKYEIVNSKYLTRVLYRFISSLRQYFLFPTFYFKN